MSGSDVWAQQELMSSTGTVRILARSLLHALLVRCHTIIIDSLEVPHSQGHIALTIYILAQNTREPKALCP